LRFRTFLWRRRQSHVLASRSRRELVAAAGAGDAPQPSGAL